MFQKFSIGRPHPAIMATMMAMAFGTQFSGANAATLTAGPGQPFSAPCAAFARALTGDTVEIMGETTYSGDVCVVGLSNLTIRGINGRPKIIAAGRNAAGKGIWVVTGNNVVVENVEMSGATVPDQNGAALRLEGNNFTLRGSFLHDNENGILSGPLPASNIVIENSEFGHNGLGNGATHNLYIGDVASLVFRYNYSHDTNIGHNLKSRAAINTIAYNRFSSTAPGETGSTATGQPSYEIDIPNAGTAYVIGNVIEQPAANANPAMLAFGEEGVSKPTQDLYVINNTFLNDDTVRGTFVLVGGGVTRPVLLQNNVFAGVGAATNQAGAINQTNYRAETPAFVNRATYNLTPAAGSPLINAGSAVGKAASGFALTPVMQYVHVAQASTRAVVGTIDIGAYEAGQADSGTVGGGGPTTLPVSEVTWIKCASDGLSCRFSGTRQVRYGAEPLYAFKVGTTSLTCSSKIFGDPAPSKEKICYFSSELQPSAISPF